MFARRRRLRYADSAPFCAPNDRIGIMGMALKSLSQCSVHGSCFTIFSRGTADKFPVVCNPSFMAEAAGIKMAQAPYCTRAFGVTMPSAWP